MQTAKLNSVPVCPRVEGVTLSDGWATVKSDEAEPGHEILAVSVGELSSFEGEERRDPKCFEVGDLVVDIDGSRIGRVADAQPAELMDYVLVNWAPLDAPGLSRVHVTTINQASADDLSAFAVVV
jgi:hypothetical protein